MCYLLVQDKSKSNRYHNFFDKFRFTKKHTESLPAAGGAPLLVRGTNIALLPVVLSTFNIQNANCSAKLSWTTDSEINSSRFVIQHSSDWLSFKELASMPAAGFSNTEKNYTYTAPLTPGKNYFRLQMIDVDGSFKYSDIVNTDANCTNSTMSVFPNPVKDILTVNGLSGTGMLVLSDNAGKKMQSVKFPSPAANLNTRNLLPGTYFLQLQQEGNTTETIKIVKN